MHIHKIVYIFFPPNGRYIDCSSLTYATNKSKTLNYSTDTKNIQSKYESPKGTE